MALAEIRVESEAGVAGPRRPNWHLQSADVDEQAQLLPQWEQSYVQLESGRFESQVDGVQVNAEMTLFRKHTSRRLHKLFSTPADTYAVALLAEGSDRIRFQHEEAGAGDVLLLPPGKAFDIVTLGRFDVAVATLDARCLPLAYDASNTTARTGRVLRACASTRRLSDLLRHALDDTPMPPADPAAARRLGQNLAARMACHMVECLSCGDAGAAPQPLVHAADSLAAARRLLIEEAQIHGQVPPVPELAGRLGMSVRQLHKLFHDRLGMPPRAYAERLRLARARADLRVARAGETTVAAVAARWGFWHLGRFASRYHALFGELPSHSFRA